MTKDQRTKHGVILDAWGSIGGKTLGATELAQIQLRLKDAFGANGHESPAGIARILADEGVQLRHPEILQADSEWREARLNTFFGPDELNFTSIDEALSVVKKIDGLICNARNSESDSDLQDLMRLVRDVKADLALNKNEVSLEVIQWLTVLLQNPVIFSDWLTLRQNSPEFRTKFRTDEV